MPPLRMAPRHIAHSPGGVGPRGRAFWRGLEFVALPVAASASGKQVGRDAAKKRSAQGGGTVVLTGDSYGPAFHCAGSGVGWLGTMPTAIPLSAFVFVARHDNSDATLQSLIGNGASGFNGWTLQLNYGAQQIGLTRWGLADNPSTALGAVPKHVASGVGLSLAGTTARFFLNGRFQDIASGAVNGTLSSAKTIGANISNAAPCQNASIYVAYAWSRAVSDGEMMALWADPWLPVRADDRWMMGAGGAPPGGSGARVFVPGFIG